MFFPEYLHDSFLFVKFPSIESSSKMFVSIILLLNVLQLCINHDKLEVAPNNGSKTEGNNL